MTTFILLIFLSVFNDLWGSLGLEGYSHIHTSTCGCKGQDVGTRWTNGGHGACPEDTEVGGQRQNWMVEYNNKVCKKCEKTVGESCQEERYQITPPLWITAMRADIWAVWLHSYFIYSMSESYRDRNNKVKSWCVWIHTATWASQIQTQQAWWKVKPKNRVMMCRVINK